MNDKVQTAFLIDKYTDLLRVKKAGDAAWLKEVENQIRATKVKLETLGVVAEQLTID